MNKQGLGNLARSVKTTLVKHSPEILTGLGIAGMITTTVLAVRATPKALELLHEAEDKKIKDQLKSGKDPDDVNYRLTPVEVVKTAWKPYIYATITGTVSIMCLIGATSVNARRNAALATAYQLSATALSDYKDEVVKAIGEKKEKEVQEKVDKKQIERNPISKAEVFVTERGNTLFLDPLSKRYFTSDIELIRRAENTLNKRMIHDLEGYVSVNDLYYEIGLSPTAVGYDLGWNTDDLIDIGFSAQLTERDEPCIALNYYVAPKYGYDR